MNFYTMASNVTDVKLDIGYLIVCNFYIQNSCKCMLLIFLQNCRIPLFLLGILASNNMKLAFMIGTRLNF
ncbi:hypothetical protein AHYW_003878 [Providencia manganoxydans]|jgi:hypothetical protein|nr:Uncharacterised protein [Morganella morganii]